MKRLISLILVLCLVGLCLPSTALAEETLEFRGMNDPKLLPYIEDTVYEALIDELSDEGYAIENVSAIYISQEYIDELAYNSQANIFFGYTLAELDAQFEGTRYVFTLGEDNQTTVVPFESYEDNTYSQILKNVAIGAGIILICVTVSVIAAPTAPAVSMIFSCAAKTGTEIALKGAATGFLAAGTLRYVQTGELDESFKAGALAGSEGFKWGAIGGCVTGAASETAFLGKWHKETKISWNDAALIQKESRYSLDFIRTVSSMDEYNVYKNAELIEYSLGDQRILLPKDFDFNIVDPHTQMTNFELMSKGLNPVDSNGVKFEWHHVGQKTDSPLALLTNAQHHDNDAALHLNKICSEVRPNGNSTAWNQIRKQLNKSLADAVSNP